MSTSPSQRIVGFCATPGAGSSLSSQLRSPASPAEPSGLVSPPAGAACSTGFRDEQGDAEKPCCDVSTKRQCPSPSSSTSRASSLGASPGPLPVSLLHDQLLNSAGDSLPIPQRSASASDAAALDMLRDSANTKAHLAELEHDHHHPHHPEAGHPRLDAAHPLERCYSTGSTPICIPSRRATLHASAAGSRPDSYSNRVLRRVPEPPIRPAAVTAPAVVQLLLAAKAAAAAERLRQELAYHCDRNNMKLAYVVQERRRVLEAHAQRLEAEGAPNERLPDPTSPQAIRRIQSEAAFKRKVDWEGWYDLPHGNIAAAEYCAGEAERALAGMML